MIEKLEPNRGYNEDGTLVWEGPCDEWSMMEKINELVEAVNRMEKQIGYPQYEVGNRKRE